MSDEKVQKWQAVVNLFFKPRKTTASILQNENHGWFMPLLISSLLILAFSIFQHQAINQQAQQQMQPMMMDSALSSDMVVKGDLAGSMSVSEMDPYAEGPNNLGSSGESTLSFVLKTSTRLLGFWGIWLILSTMLHLGLMISGGNLAQRDIFRLVAWSALVVAARSLIQVLYLIFTHQPILGEGLSGLLPVVDGQASFLAFVLGSLDIYFFWQFVLLFIGICQLSNLSKPKIASVLGINAVLILFLAALPSFVIERILAAFSSTAGFF